MKGQLNAEELEARRHRMGASDVAAALGLSPYCSSMQLWLIKTGRIVDEGDSIPARRGRALEPLVLDLYEEEHLREREALWRNELDEPRTYTEPWMTATVDAVVYSAQGNQDGDAVRNPVRLVEAKTANRHTAHKFGVEGSDEVPTEYVVQCAWQMMIWDLPACDLMAFVDDEPRKYTIHRDDDLERKMLAKVRSFWQLVQDDTPPELDGGDGTAQFLDLQFPTASAAVRDADDTEFELARELRIAQELRKSAVEEERRIKHELASLIGDDKGIRGDFGSIHWTSQARDTTDWKAVALEAGAAAELVDAHTKTIHTKRAIRPYFKKES